MSTIAEELLRLQGAKETFSDKGVELGISLGTDKIDAIADKFDAALSKIEVTEEVKEGETFNIPQGYHDGSGTVSGVAGGGNYLLQSKNATPTKETQQIVSDDGFFGLSDVTVAPIPDAYQDTSGVTATAADVLTGKSFVNALGEVIEGQIAINEAEDTTLSTETSSYTIEAGYYETGATISIALEQKTVTPSLAEQVIEPEEGKVLSKVTVEKIPTEYVDMSEVEIDLAAVLDGTEVVTKNGVETGIMTDNGSVVETFDGLTETSYTIVKGYHDGTGTVSLTDDIYNALAAI